MKLQEAYELVLPLIGSTINIEKETVANKGKFGHALEKFLGLNLGSHPHDFEDGGDLKSCASRNNKLKEDFKICKVWDKEYIRDKISNMLLVIFDYDTGIIQSVQKLSIFDHPLVNFQFDKDLDYLLAQPDINLVSQKETEVFVAKTNDKGNKEVNERACYIARAPASYLFGLQYSGYKGKQFVKEMEKYEQTETGGTA